MVSKGSVKTARDPDGVDLPLSTSELAPVLTWLFHRCISSRMFPPLWKLILVYLTPKKV